MDTNKLNILIFLCLFIFINSINAQSNWDQISYHYSIGSEHQYAYNIVIHSDKKGRIMHIESGTRNDYDFIVSKKGMKKLNSTLKKDKLLLVSDSELLNENEKNLPGDPERNAVITFWQPPEIGAKPRTIIIPSLNQLNEKYKKKILNLYEIIEDLVPNSIWKKVKN